VTTKKRRILMKRFIVYVLLAALTSMAMPGMNISFAAETVFSISAEDNAGTGRSQINISLNGINLNDLYAYEAVLSFDSEKLELIKAVSEINGFSVSPKIKGDKAYIAFTKVGDVNGENGNMKLSTITFRGKVSGTASIKLESFRTVDSKLASQTYMSGESISVAVRRADLVLEPVFDKAAGAATATLSMTQITGLLSEVPADSSGIKTIEIEILQAEGAGEYVLNFPVQALINPAACFIIRTPLGTVRIPGNILAGEMAHNAEYASIRLGIAGIGNLNDTLKKQIGNRPVIILQIELNGNTNTRNNPNAAVRADIPYHPTAEEAADFEHIVVWHIDAEGNVKPVETGVYNNQQGNVSFVTNYFGTFAVSFVKKTFDDVRNHWSRKYVDVMASRGIIKGLPNNLFGYQYDITRADYVTLLVRMLGISAAVETNFDDVKADDYFYHTVGIAKMTGIVKADGNLFRPRDPITREEMMVFTASALKYAKPELGQVNYQNYDILNEFSDANLVSAEALESVALLVDKKIIVGAGGKLLPKAKMTRAEAAAVLYRLFKIIWGE